MELRHATVSCPRCHKRVEVKRRTRLWQGDDLKEARSAVALHRAAAAQGTSLEAASFSLRPDAPVPRYDDPVDAAAAKGRGTTNKSDRADLVLLWLTRLQEDVPHDDAIRALRRSGLDAERAEKEVVRMLAGDVIFEPRAGSYRHLEA